MNMVCLCFSSEVNFYIGNDYKYCGNVESYSGINDSKWYVNN